ncbi:hypothetical protein, partial [Escherichia coli]
SPETEPGKSRMTRTNDMAEINFQVLREAEQVKRENQPVEAGAWKDAVEWVLQEDCQAVNIRIKGE